MHLSSLVSEASPGKPACFQHLPFGLKGQQLAVGHGSQALAGIRQLPSGLVSSSTHEGAYKVAPIVLRGYASMHSISEAATLQPGPWEDWKTSSLTDPVPALGPVSIYRRLLQPVCQAGREAGGNLQVRKGGFSSPPQDPGDINPGPQRRAESPFRSIPFSSHWPYPRTWVPGRTHTHTHTHMLTEACSSLQRLVLRTDSSSPRGLLTA